MRLGTITASSSVGVADEMRVWLGMPADVYAGDLSRQPLRGKVSLTGFRVARRIRMFAPPLSNLSSYRMLFQTWASGTFVPEPTGTQVNVAMTVFRGVGCYWLVVLGMTLLFASATIGSSKGWPVLIVPVPFIGLGVFARLAARSDVDFLLRQLKSTFQGSVVEG